MSSELADKVITHNDIKIYQMAEVVLIFLPSQLSKETGEFEFKWICLNCSTIIVDLPLQKVNLITVVLHPHFRFSPDTSNIRKKHSYPC